MQSAWRRPYGGRKHLPLLLAATFLAPLLLIGVGGGAAAGAPTYTLTTFADGASTRIALFLSCTSTDSSSGFLFPFNASILSASLDVTVAVDSSSLTGSFSADVGSDGRADGVANLTTLSSSHLD